MSPLWGGRFTGEMDALMARFNASLPFDWRLWEADHHRIDSLGARDCPGRAAGARCVRADRGGVAGVARRDRTRPGRGLRRGHGRGHTQLCRAKADRAHWAGRGQAAHRSQPQRSGGHRRAVVAEGSDCGVGRPTGRSGAHRRRPGRGRVGRADARLHPPATGAAGALEPLAAEPCLGLATRSGTARRSGETCGCVAPRFGRAGRLSLPGGSRALWQTTWASRRSAQTVWTPSATATSSPSSSFGPR